MHNVRAIRGATTAVANTKDAIREVVDELLDKIEKENKFDPEDIVSVIFTATSDLNAIFPAAIARKRPQWKYVPLLDVQQMQVDDSLDSCIRVLIQINSAHSQKEMKHIYLRGAKYLRSDLVELD